MIKIKVLLIGTAILIAGIGLYATRPKDACENSPQFYKFNNFYLPAGELGVTYTCVGNIGICTYVQDPNHSGSYIPCKTGSFRYIY